VDRTDKIAFLLAVVFVLCQIAIPPTIGLADNGDFAKIAGKFNLWPEATGADLYGRYATIRYASSPDHHWESGFLTTATALSWSAITVGRVWSRDGSFDIRLLGFLHATLFLTAFALALPLFRAFQKSARLLLIALALLIFCDTMYVEYFSSFFMDAPAFLFLLLAVALFLRARYLPLSSPFAAFFLLACCCLFVLTKTQHVLLFIPLIFFCVQDCALLFPSKPFLSRAIAVGSLTACSLLAYRLTPPGYTAPALFTVIVRGLLPSAKNPSAELRELGLDDSFLQYSGMTAYSPGTPVFNPNYAAAFEKRTSYKKLAVFYLRHPWRAAAVLENGLNGASYQRVPYLGNFDKTAGYLPYVKSHRFSLWSDFKTKLLSNRGWAYLIYFLALIALLAQRSSDYVFALATMALLELAVGALADSAEGTRHLFIFNFLVDLIGISAVAAAMRVGPIRCEANARHPKGS
jgi:hypothetical protein